MTPFDHYTQRLQQRESRLGRLAARQQQIEGLRLALAALFLLSLWLCFGRLSLPADWLWVPVAGFVAAVVWHQRVVARRRRAQRAVQVYRTGLARLNDEWSGAGPTGLRFATPQHIYADDLDLFGNDGLFQLLCAARTQMGESTLALWLLNAADQDTIRGRQSAIRDLRPRLDLQEDVAVAGESGAIELHPDKLIDWAEAPNQLDARVIRIGVPLLAGLAVLAALYAALGGATYPLIALLLGELAALYALRKRTAAAISAVEGAYEDLKGLAVLLKRFETEHFESPEMHTRVSALSSHALSASNTLAKLATLVNFVEARRNPLLTPFMWLIMYPVLTALAAERWRRAHGASVRQWLDTLGELEALLSLARHSFENPGDPFPEFVDGASGFRAEQLGHPLIPAARRICNDVDLSGSTRVLLVSGSNMSGKSTLLRTVGINTVLAMAGAPVRAKRLVLTPLRIGASIRVNDSLHEGSSRFYAEITRLRQLFEPAALPLLFLLDELLQGTNSADRRVGAHGIIRALIERGAIGLVSTHDLALTDIGGLGTDALVNVHFQDELKDGRLTFDFTLHPGIVTKSNGIALMRSIGLDV